MEPGLLKGHRSRNVPGCCASRARMASILPMSKPATVTGSTLFQRVLMRVSNCSRWENQPWNSRNSSCVILMPLLRASGVLGKPAFSSIDRMSISVSGRVRPAPSYSCMMYSLSASRVQRAGTSEPMPGPRGKYSLPLSIMEALASWYMRLMFQAPMSTLATPSGKWPSMPIRTGSPIALPLMPAESERLDPSKGLCMPGWLPDTALLCMGLESGAACGNGIPPGKCGSYSLYCRHRCGPAASPLWGSSVWPSLSASSRSSGWFFSEFPRSALSARDPWLVMCAITMVGTW
mmetsp:Transcript_40023/g.95105  ORF Transcript_40023/g.95105 Transcript_40023/m.95105 type:complete len:291 (-) Transcript_40023:990-1862(-)